MSDYKSPLAFHGMTGGDEGGEKEGRVVLGQMESDEGAHREADDVSLTVVCMALDESCDARG